jgi:tripartite-type tricarboxylate transporter receptor subunit TctC
MQKQPQHNRLQRRSFITAAACGLAGPLGVTSLWAQTGFPNKPVRIIVPYAAGGGPDVLTRKVGPKLGEILGQPIVVENIVGAGGILAAQSVARAAPDGYTVLLGASTHVVQKAMQPSVKFDPLKDFAPITRNTVSPALLVVAANAPWKTVQELIAAIKKEPGKLNYASGGIGSAAHLSSAALLLATDADAVHVPYKGSVEIIPSLLSGSTQFGCPIASTAVGPVLQGQVRALATTGAVRMPQLPNVPTLKEVFGKDELVLESWGCFWAPVGTPAAVLDVLFKAFTKLYSDPTIRAEHEAAGAPVSLNASPAEFGKFLEAETIKYGRIVKAIGLNGN